ncbi:MAG TPA: hypothetical protein VFA51_11420 [Candidatus Udaeobacter sp.]|nr:hypothetical protein [Candidatus Udaeobacter sp.]
MTASGTQNSDPTVAAFRASVLAPVLSILLLVILHVVSIPTAWSQQLLRRESFSVGIYPQAMAFDGANIWVTSGQSQYITKLRASDGTLLGTFPVGTITVGATFDGTYVWLANWGYGANSLTRVRLDGSVEGVYPIGPHGPYSLMFDGTNIWVSTLESHVIKMRASDGVVLGDYSTTTGSSPCLHLAFDGANVWVTNNYYNTVSKLRATDGELLGTFSVGHYPIGVTFDGSSIWVTSSGDDYITKLRASDGVFLGRARMGAAPSDVTFDGRHIWVANVDDGTATALGDYRGVIHRTFRVGDAPQNILFDGTNIWVANFYSATVTKISPSQ